MGDCLNEPVQARHLRAVSDESDNEFAWHCDNGRCGKPLPNDHIIMVTTRHVRRFCSVPCITAGHWHHLAQISREALAR